MNCDKCRKPIVATGCGAGYGTDGKEKYCYACCGEADRADMIATGCATMYLTGSPDGTPKIQEVTNWPGTLRFPVLYSKGLSVFRARPTDKCAPDKAMRLNKIRDDA
jgi:hypothetical protein